MSSAEENSTEILRNRLTEILRANVVEPFIMEQRNLISVSKDTLKKSPTTMVNERKNYRREFIFLFFSGIINPQRPRRSH